MQAINIMGIKLIAVSCLDREQRESSILMEEAGKHETLIYWGKTKKDLL